jgi:hypothetical protein
VAAIAVAVLGVFLGVGCIYLVHCPCRVLSKIGRRLYLAVLVALGGVGLFAAVTRHDGLVPLGMLVGLLIVAMLWEGPSAEPERTIS